MAAQMIIRASGRVSAVARNVTVAALKVEVAAAGATAGHYATHGAFRALAVACGALGLVGGAAYLCYSRGVGFTKYLLSPATTSKATRHDRQRFCTEVRSNY
nr:uncharacterized protein LOC127292249 isoform X2 [Lolium perenne]